MVYSKLRHIKLNNIEGITIPICETSVFKKRVITLTYARQIFDIRSCYELNLPISKNCKIIFDTDLYYLSLLSLGFDTIR